jgi:hypothetical protein
MHRIDPLTHADPACEKSIQQCRLLASMDVDGEDLEWFIGKVLQYQNHGVRRSREAFQRDHDFAEWDETWTQMWRIHSGYLVAAVD